MGVETREVKAGCCGLAVSWGFESGHYALSLEIAEDGLLPAVRASSADELVIANGFSCRTRLEHCALHIAQVRRPPGDGDSGRISLHWPAAGRRSSAG